MSLLKTAAVAALSVMLAAPAFGGELEDGLAAINAAVAGPWKGAVNAIDPSSGAQTPIAYDITVVVTSDDGLDYAYWGPEGLTMIDYQADGMVSVRTWSEAGVLTTDSGVVALGEISESWTLSDTTIGPDGNSYDVVSTYVLADGGLTYRQEASLAGDADAPKLTLATGSWTRP